MGTGLLLVVCEREFQLPQQENRAKLNWTPPRCMRCPGTTRWVLGSGAWPGTEARVRSERALCSRHTAAAAASAPQHIRDTHRDDAAGHRASEIRPPRGPVT